MPRASTRDTILQEALDQAAVRGLEGISIGGLAGALGMSKSGVFAHFKSLEALQLAILETAIALFTQRVVGPALSEGEPGARLDRLFEGQLDWMAGAAGAPGCLFTGAIQEFDDQPGALRDRLLASQRDWSQLLATTVREAVAAGQLAKDTDVRLLVFQIVGVALAYQHASRFLGDPQARTLAEAAYRSLRGGA